MEPVQELTARDILIKGKSPDLWARLGLTRDATKEQIGLRAIFLLKKYHPDLNPDRRDECNQVSAIITGARATLLDPDALAKHCLAHGIPFKGAIFESQRREAAIDKNGPGLSTHVSGTNPQLYHDTQVLSGLLVDATRLRETNKQFFLDPLARAAGIYGSKIDKLTDAMFRERLARAVREPDAAKLFPPYLEMLLSQGAFGTKTASMMSLFGLSASDYPDIFRNALIAVFSGFTPEAEKENLALVKFIVQGIPRIFQDEGILEALRSSWQRLWQAGLYEEAFHLRNTAQLPKLKLSNDTLKFCQLCVYGELEAAVDLFCSSKTIREELKKLSSLRKQILQKKISDIMPLYFAVSDEPEESGNTAESPAEGKKIIEKLFRKSVKSTRPYLARTGYEIAKGLMDGGAVEAPERIFAFMQLIEDTCGVAYPELMYKKGEDRYPEKLYLDTEMMYLSMELEGSINEGTLESLKARASKQEPRRYPR